MVMPQPFTTGTERLVTYNWEDVFKGVAYISYYAGNSTNSVGTTYFLTPTTQSAQPPYETATAVAIDRDYDLNFDQEEDVEGTLIINFTQRPGSPGSAGTCVAVITIYHVSTGAAETSLGTATTPTRNGSGTYYRENLQIDVARTHFSPGEKLRINVVFTGAANVGFLYTDPSSGLSVSDTYGRTVGTDFVVQIPFKIES